MSQKNVHLLIIDPQNDFCNQKGSLFVPGADTDSKRLAACIDRIGRKIPRISVTLDSHHKFDVAHPGFWSDSQGNSPPPFTIITVDDMKNGTWRTRHPGVQKSTLEYLEKLDSSGRYPLCVWPEHCLIGSWGNNVVDPVFKSLLNWEETRLMVDFVTKGSNWQVEHYSAVQAEVPDPNDPSTQLNTRLITTLQQADVVLLTGQALSHCVANTVRDIANNFGDENIKKLVLLTDTTSHVPIPLPDGSDLGRQMADDFLNELTSRGMQTANSTEFVI